MARNNSVENVLGEAEKCVSYLLHPRAQSCRTEKWNRTSSLEVLGDHSYHQKTCEEVRQRNERCQGCEQTDKQGVEIELESSLVAYFSSSLNSLKQPT